MTDYKQVSVFVRCRARFRHCRHSGTLASIAFKDAIAQESNESKFARLCEWPQIIRPLEVMDGIALTAPDVEAQLCPVHP